MAIFLRVVDTMASPFYYILTLYFKTIVEWAIICNILSFFLHPYFGMVWVSDVLIFFNMERYTIDGESHKESQREWSQNS